MKSKRNQIESVPYSGKDEIIKGHKSCFLDQCIRWLTFVFFILFSMPLHFHPPYMIFIIRIIRNICVLEFQVFETGVLANFAEKWIVDVKNLVWN